MNAEGVAAADATHHDARAEGEKLLGLDASSPFLEPTPQQTGAPLRNGIFVLANTLLGAGMLGLPAAFADCGYVVGTLMLTSFAACGMLGLHLLAEVADRSGRPASFKSVADAAVPGCSLVFDSAIAIKCFGVASSYLIVVGDSVPKAADAFGLRGVWVERRVWVAVAIVIAGPLAFMRHITALRMSAALALACVLLITLMVLLFAVQPAGLDIFTPCDGPCAPPLQTLTLTHGHCWRRCCMPLARKRLPRRRKRRRGRCGGERSVGSDERKTPTSKPHRASPLSIASAPSSGHTGASPLDFAANPTKVDLGVGRGAGPPHSIVPVTDPNSTIRALPLFVFAYTCHQNIISISNELHRPTRGRVLFVIVAAVGAACSVYLVLAFSGYVTFGNAVASDVLSSYPEDSKLVAIARVMIALVVSMCYPLQAHPSRTCISSIVSAAAARAGHEIPAETLHILISAAFVSSTTAVAMLVDDLGKVLSVVGATGSTTVSFILPGVCYFLLCRREGGVRKWAALMLLLMGVVIMPLSLVLIFS